MTGTPPRARHPHQRAHSPANASASPARAGTSPCPDTHVVDDRDGARALARRIDSARRERPVVLVSTRTDTQQPRVDVDALVATVGAHADVVVLATWEVSLEVSQHLRSADLLYGGAIGLYPAPESPADSGSSSRRYFTANGDGSATIAAVAADLAAGATPEGDDTARGAVGDEARAAAADDLVAVPEDVLRAPAQAPAGDGAALAALARRAAAARADGRSLFPSARTVDAAEQDDSGADDGTAEDLAAALAAATAVADEAHRRLASEQERGRALSDEVVRLRRQVRSLGDQNEDLRRRLHGQQAFADPEQQLRHEIHLYWLAAFPEDQRQALPLRPFDVTAEFLTSLDSLQGVSRERVVAACADVVCTHVWYSNGRAAHQHRESASPRSATVVRGDGAALWRCAIQVNSPSARRLMWWERVDGSVELAKVAVHDDMHVRQ